MDIHLLHCKHFSLSSDFSQKLREVHLLPFHLCSGLNAILSSIFFVEDAVVLLSLGCYKPKALVIDLFRNLYLSLACEKFTLEVIQEKCWLVLSCTCWTNTLLLDVHALVFMFFESTTYLEFSSWNPLVGTEVTATDYVHHKCDSPYIGPRLKLSASVNGSIPD